MIDAYWTYLTDPNSLRVDPPFTATIVITCFLASEKEGEK